MMDSNLDLKEIHKKWQQKWQETKIFEPQIGSGDKFYLTAAYPYPNSPQHVGHARTYTTTDIYARYQRLLGKNVLFPMAFHVTGTPIFAMAKRLEEQDGEILGVFENIYNIPKEKAKELTDPKELVLYFSKEIEQGMKEIGYSIDWTRKFYTFDERYNHFITWQFQKLNQARLIAKGKHPVPWCPKDGQAVGGHDTRGDVDPKIEEVVVVLFKANDAYIPTTTYRPDTLLAVTNLWANPNAKYVLVSYDDKQLYLSQKAFELLSEQLDLKKISDVCADEILALKPIHPITNKELPVLSAEFVKEQVGTGLVMSVPAHAPFDYLALRDCNMLEQIPLIAAIKTAGFGQFAAKDIVEKMQIKSQSDPLAEEATKILYKKDAHEGKMISAGYEHLTCAQAKEKITKDLIDMSAGFHIYVLANSPIYSRSGGLCTVKIVDNQWFIDYSDPKWKEKTRLCLQNMKIIPNTLRKDFEYMIGWLERKACTRAFGFGTKFPFDQNQLIEALSDSTLYMAYYTIANITAKMQSHELSEEFFDFVFLSKNPSDTSKINENWQSAKQAFNYWYPLNSRHSALDLVTNHLPFFIFNHTAIFDSDKWPKEIITNGLVTMEGKKMSKSMGNILPLRTAISQYGPDAIRFTVTSTAEIDADSDFSKSVVEGAISRIIQMHSLLLASKNQIAPQIYDDATKWFYSRFHSRIKNAKLQYENLQLRPLAQSIFYECVNDLQWYQKRCKQPYLREFFEYWTILISPFMPHIAEEFWEILADKQFVPNSKFCSTANFPVANEQKINSELDSYEDFLKTVREDIIQIKQILRMQNNPSEITLIVHAPYKQKVRKFVAEYKDMNKIMSACKEDVELSQKMSIVSKLAPKYLKQIAKLIGDTLGASREFEILQNAKDFLSCEFDGAKITILNEEDAPEDIAQKASNAQPNKPSIMLK